jgi:hypothetical protein
MTPAVIKSLYLFKARMWYQFLNWDPTRYFHYLALCIPHSCSISLFNISFQGEIKALRTRPIKVNYDPWKVMRFERVPAELSECRLRDICVMTASSSNLIFYPSILSQARGRKNTTWLILALPAGICEKLHGSLPKILDNCMALARPCN